MKHLLTAACGGTVSAEHGVGIAKARWLHLTRGDGELRAMRAIKAALDPTGMLNPGVVLAAGLLSSIEANRRAQRSSERRVGDPGLPKA